MKGFFSDLIKGSHQLTLRWGVVEAAITHPAASFRNCIVSALGLEHSSIGKLGGKAITGPRFLLLSKTFSPVVGM